MKIYIAGSITNDPNYKEHFAAAEKRLLEEGHLAVNPAKNVGFDYKEYIDLGLYELMHCEAIYLLDGYESSRGANLEYHYALTTGLKIIKEKGASE